MKNNQDKNVFNIKNKVIAIIGSTGILGKQYCEYLASNGAIVIIGDINYDACKTISKELNKKKYKTFPLFIDNTNEESIINYFNIIVDTYNKIDVLINNAQVKPNEFYAPFEAYPKKTLLEVIDGNLIGVTIACREVCKIFLKQNYGKIINVSSLYGIVAPDQRIYEGVKNIYFPDYPFSSPVSYAISKAGVVQLTKYLASYYRGKNICVNCLTPGGVYDNHDQKFLNNYCKNTLLGKMAEKNDYNGTIHYLVSEASNYMTGFNVVVDGGWSTI